MRCFFALVSFFPLTHLLFFRFSRFRSAVFDVVVDFSIVHSVQHLDMCLRDVVFTRTKYRLRSISRYVGIGGSLIDRGFVNFDSNRFLIHMLFPFCRIQKGLQNKKTGAGCE